MALLDVQVAYEKDENLLHLHTDPKIKYVPGIGVATPSVMVIGEAPGQFENFHRQPFCGPSGELLSKMLSLAGLSHLVNTFITNVVKYRPVDDRKFNRKPTVAEVQASLPYLMDEWKTLQKPAVIISLGDTATRAVMAIDGNYKLTTTITKAATHLIPLENLPVILIPMVHPAYILRNEHLKSEYEGQWRHIGNWLNGNNYLR